MAMVTPLRWAVLALALCSLPLSLHAQGGTATSPPAGTPAAIQEAYRPQNTFENIDHETDVSWSEFHLIDHANPCLTDVSNGLPRRNCFGDPINEDRSREEVRAQNRWIRAGLLLAASLWVGVQQLRSMMASGKDLVHAIDKITHGFNARRPESTAIRLASASDVFGADLQLMQDVSMMSGWKGNDGRYAEIDAFVMRALAQAKDAHAAAVTLSDQTTAAQARLEPTGQVRLVSVGGPPVSAYGGMVPPASIDDESPATPMAIAAHLGYDPRVPPAGPMRAAGNGSLPPGLCSVPEDEAEPIPSTVYQRAMVEAKGAQIASTVAAVNVQHARSEIQTLIEREKQARREDAWLSTMRSVYP